MKGKTCSKLANGLNLYDLKKKLTPEAALTLPWGYIHNTILVKQVYWYISQVSGERLQDHWSSGFIYFHYKSMVDNDMPGAWPEWTPGVPFAALIKESIIHWSTQHMKALGHMVSEKKIFLAHLKVSL